MPNNSSQQHQQEQQENETLAWYLHKAMSMMSTFVKYVSSSLTGSRVGLQNIQESELISSTAGNNNTVVGSGGTSSTVAATINTGNSHRLTPKRESNPAKITIDIFNNNNNNSYAQQYLKQQRSKSQQEHQAFKFHPNTTTTHSPDDMSNNVSGNSFDDVCIADDESFFISESTLFQGSSQDKTPSQSLPVSSNNNTQTVAFTNNNSHHHNQPHISSCKSSISTFPNMVNASQRQLLDDNRLTDLHNNTATTSTPKQLTSTCTSKEHKVPQMTQLEAGHRQSLLESTEFQEMMDEELIDIDEDNDVDHSSSSSDRSESSSPILISSPSPPNSILFNYELLQHHHNNSQHKTLSRYRQGCSSKLDNFSPQELEELRERLAIYVFPKN